MAAVSGGGKDFLCDLSAALSLALGSPPSVSVRRSRLRSARRFCGGALAHARLAALWRRSRSRSVRRFCGGGFRRRQRLFVRPSGGALARARLAASVRRLVRRSRSRSVRRFVAALSLALGSPLCGGALAHARFAALWRRSRAARFAARSARTQSRAQKNARAPFLSTGSRLKYP